MNVNDINHYLISDALDRPGLFPHVESLASQQCAFNVDFGLRELPTEPGIILIRGARQYGKSTWLESALRDTVRHFGPGSALYLNGDEIASSDRLLQDIREVVTLFSPTSAVRRLFIDEITAVKNWERAVKRLADAGELRNVLLVTTGSKATDLRHGAERLPGRKGKLERSTYLFTPVSYREFKRVCEGTFGPRTLHAYLTAGGCPVACAELARLGRIPEYVTQMVRDWVYGECSASGRERSSILGVLEYLAGHGTSPCGQAKLARETGMANNTVAAGYIELLSDLMCIGTTSAWDLARKAPLHRKPAKFPFINLLAAHSWHASQVRTVDDFDALTPTDQGTWYEWAVAQELWRRAAITGDEFPERLCYWQSDRHEVDFVSTRDGYIEVKRGEVSPLEFTWFASVFGKETLTVVNARAFTTMNVCGITLEEFLLQQG